MEKLRKPQISTWTLKKTVEEHWSDENNTKSPTSGNLLTPLLCGGVDWLLDIYIACRVTGVIQPVPHRRHLPWPAFPQRGGSQHRPLSTAAGMHWGQLQTWQLTSMLFNQATPLPRLPSPSLAPVDLSSDRVPTLPSTPPCSCLTRHTYTNWPFVTIYSELWGSHCFTYQS